MQMNQEEKIDYIYKTLKKQEVRYKVWFWFKWGFRILMLIYFYYFINYLLPSYVENFKDYITPNIADNITNNINKIDKSELLDKFKSLYNK